MVPAKDLHVQVGNAMHEFASELYPLCRSITGNGLRETLRRIQRRIPLDVHEVRTGTQVFDWTVPKEWNLRNAYVKNEAGEVVIDFTSSNLHVVNYSVPVRTRMSLEELKPHLYSLPEHPDWVPYKTSYYKNAWGFCLPHRQLEAFPPGQYEVVIDSSLEDGSLSYGECYVEGESRDEILISCHVCHPSLCNDNLSGIAVSTFLADRLRERQRRYSYRFLFVPGTIGSITWLARNENIISRIKHGLVISCVGDGGAFTYKRSRRGDAEIDHVVEHVLKHKAEGYRLREFAPYGYDERQYCSPGFDLPVGALSRTPHSEFPQYHTSADDLNFIRPQYLAESLDVYLAISNVLEQNRRYQNQSPKGEPQLGKRGLYRQMGGKTDQPLNEFAMLWVLKQSDGSHSLLDIAQKSGLYFGVISEAARKLETVGLLRLS